MFATITSKDHAQNIQQDLQNIYFTDSYRDTILQCSDGHMIISRLLTGLLFPFLKDHLTFQLLEEVTLLLPQYNKLEIEKSIYNLLGIKYSDQSEEDSQDDSMMSEWSEAAIDNIIDNLQPEKVAKSGKVRTRSAVLHSAITKETAVLHSAVTKETAVLHQEDEKDLSEGVLVVNEVDTDDGAHSDSGKRGVHPRQIQPKQPQQRLHTIQQQIIQQQMQEIVMVPRRFVCSLCPAVFPAHDQLEAHVKLHQTKYKCQYCTAAFCKMRELTEHARIHSAHKLVKCNICDKDFTEKGLRQHTDRFHRVVLDPRDATKPVKKRELKRSPRHLQDKQEEDLDDPDVVEQYPKNNVYFSSDSEDETESEVADTSPVKVRKTEHCATCDKYFTKKGIKIHKHRTKKDRKVKEGKKPALKKMFECMYCHKTFSHMASMKVHEKVHVGGKPHHCDMCSAKFSNKFDLFAHEKEHSAHRPHKCDMCIQTFKTPESLRFHKLIHEESIPNVCKFCSKSFKNRIQLENHERVHEGEKPYNCDKCSTSFETATKLTRHITSNHLKQ